MLPAKKPKIDEGPSPKGPVPNILSPETARAMFAAFKDFLERNGPYDVVIDGANVGYFGLSCWENSAVHLPVVEAEIPVLQPVLPTAHPSPQPVASVKPAFTLPVDNHKQAASTGESPRGPHVASHPDGEVPLPAPPTNGSSKTKQRHNTPLSEARGIITQCIKDGDSARAVSVLLEYQKAQPTAPPLDMTANTLHLCATAGLPQAGFDVLAAYHADTRNKPALNERCYAALLRLHCLRGTPSDVATAVELLDAMKQNGIPLKNRSYHPILACCHALDSVEHALQVYHHAVAAGVELSEAELGVVVRLCMRHRRFGDLETVLQDMKARIPSVSAETLSLLEDVFVAESGLASRRVTIDDSGECPGCGGQLQVDDITPEERDQLLEDLSQLLTQPRARMPGKTSGTAPRYESIEAALTEARKGGRKVLLVLHSRHLKPGRIPEEHQELVQRWVDEGIVYGTPQLLNDDHFWLYAALWSTHRARGLIVTNDHMRDHLFQLLVRGFPKWREAHRVRLKSPAPGTTTGGFVPPALVFPAAYTVCIQGLPCSPNAPDAPTLRWHFPSAKDSSGTIPWLCAGPALPTVPG